MYIVLSVEIRICIFNVGHEIISILLRVKQRPNKQYISLFGLSKNIVCNFKNPNVNHKKYRYALISYASRITLLIHYNYQTKMNT